MSWENNHPTWERFPIFQKWSAVLHRRALRGCECWLLERGCWRCGKKRCRLGKSCFSSAGTGPRDLCREALSCSHSLDSDVWKSKFWVSGLSSRLYHGPSTQQHVGCGGAHLIPLRRWRQADQECHVSLGYMRHSLKTNTRKEENNGFCDGSRCVLMVLVS